MVGNDLTDPMIIIGTFIGFSLLLWLLLLGAPPWFRSAVVGISGQRSAAEPGPD